MAEAADAANGGNARTRTPEAGERECSRCRKRGTARTASHGGQGKRTGASAGAMAEGNAQQSHQHHGSSGGRDEQARGEREPRRLQARKSGSGDGAIRGRSGYSALRFALRLRRVD